MDTSQTTSSDTLIGFDHGKCADALAAVVLSPNLLSKEVPTSTSSNVDWNEKAAADVGNGLEPSSLQAILNAPSASVNEIPAASPLPDDSVPVEYSSAKDLVKLTLTESLATATPTENNAVESLPTIGEVPATNLTVTHFASPPFSSQPSSHHASSHSSPSVSLSSASSSISRSSDSSLNNGGAQTPLSSLTLDFLSPTSSPPVTGCSSTSSLSGRIPFTNRREGSQATFFSPPTIVETEAREMKTEAEVDEDIVNEVLLDRTLSCNDSGSSSQSSASPCIGISPEPSTLGVPTTGAIPPLTTFTNATPSHNAHAITTTVTLHPLDPPIMIAPLPDAMSYSATAELEVCEEQQAHIASLVRKGLSKKKKSKAGSKTLRKLKLSPPLNPATPVAQTPSSATHPRFLLSLPSPATYHLPTTRGVGAITPGHNRSYSTNSLLPVPSPARSPMVSPSLAFGASPRNMNVFKLKLPMTPSVPLSPAEEEDEGEAGAEGDDEDGLEDDDEDEYCLSLQTPGNAGLGVEDDYGEIILMGIHDSSKKKHCRSEHTSDTSGSESEQTPVASGVLKLPSSANMSLASTPTAMQSEDLKSIPIDTFDTSVADAAAQLEIMDMKRCESDPSELLAEQSDVVGDDAISSSSIVSEIPAAIPDSQPTISRRLSSHYSSRRATLANTHDLRARMAARTNAPYDFSANGSLLIEGWEISKKGITRTPELKDASIGGSAGVSSRESSPKNFRAQRRASMCNMEPTARRSSFAFPSSEPVSLANTPTLLGRRLSLVKAMREKDAPGTPPELIMPSRTHSETLSAVASAVDHALAHIDLKATESADESHDFLAKEQSDEHSQPPVIPSSPILSNLLSGPLTDESLQQAFGPKFKVPREAPGLGIELRLSDLVRIGEIGRGVNGAVHKAVYLPTLSIVALKSVSIFDKDERHQFLQELRGFLNCQSPHMVRFVGACFSEGKITMALEYLNRGSLDHVVQRSGPLTEPALRIVAQQILMGIRDLHAQFFLHRDIKPANQLIDNRGIAKVSDFGLLKQLVANEAGMREDKKFVGTMLYLAPERIAGQAFSFPSDIYAVGLSFIFLATGELQSVPKDYWALVQGAVNAPSPSLPAESADGKNKFSANLRDFIDCMMHKDPKARWTAEQLLQHPWFKEEEMKSPNCEDPLADWPGKEMQQPDREELATLIDAVLHRWYPQLKRMRDSATIFEPSQHDLNRFTHLAGQLGWDNNAVIEAFVERIQEHINGTATASEDSNPECGPAVSMPTIVPLRTPSVDKTGCILDFTSATPPSTNSFSSSPYPLSSESSATPVAESPVTTEVMCVPTKSPAILPSRALHVSPAHAAVMHVVPSPAKPPMVPRSVLAPFDLGSESSPSSSCSSTPPSRPRLLSASSRRASFSRRMAEAVDSGSSVSPALLNALRRINSPAEAANARDM